MYRIRWPSLSSLLLHYGFLRYALFDLYSFFFSKNISLHSLSLSSIWSCSFSRKPMVLHWLFFLMRLFFIVLIIYIFVLIYWCHSYFILVVFAVFSQLQFIYFWCFIVAITFQLSLLLYRFTDPVRAGLDVVRPSVARWLSSARSPRLSGPGW